MQEELTMANEDKGPNLEKRLDHQLEIEDDLYSEIHEITRYHVKYVWLNFLQQL